MQEMVRFMCYVKLNHMLHRLVNLPPISLSFNLAVVVPRWSISRVSSIPQYLIREELTLIGQGVDYQGL
jgi:hypothetical protein